MVPSLIEFNPSIEINCLNLLSYHSNGLFLSTLASYREPFLDVDGSLKLLLILETLEFIGWQSAVCIVDELGGLLVKLGYELISCEHFDGRTSA